LILTANSSIAPCLASGLTKMAPPIDVMLNSTSVPHLECLRQKTSKPDMSLHLTMSHAFHALSAVGCLWNDADRLRKRRIVAGNDAEAAPVLQSDADLRGGIRNLGENKGWETCTGSVLRSMSNHWVLRDEGGYEMKKVLPIKCGMWIQGSG